MFKYEQAHWPFGADLFGAYCQLRVLSERSRQGDCFISIPQGEGGAAPVRTSNGVERRARRAAYKKVLCSSGPRHVRHWRRARHRDSKAPLLCLCPFRAHLVNDSAVNHFGAYSGGIVGDFDMEFHDRWCEKRKSLERDRDLKVGVRPQRKNSEQRQDSEARLQRQHEWSARQCLSGPIA